jgi:dipeptidyl aminopeptidase/acylaminoacyl peptidase
MKLFKQILFLFILVIINNAEAFEREVLKDVPLNVFEEHKNIYCTINNNKKIKITNINKDKLPCLSPDKKYIAFVRTSNIHIPNNCGIYITDADIYVEQLWIYDFVTKKEHLLVSGNFSCDNPKKSIMDPHNLQFSNDSKTIYFLASGWVVSAALHVVNIDGTCLRYVEPANSYEVVRTGKYKDCLILFQHRYYNGGGSYDGYWLFTKEGRLIKPLGPTCEFKGI